MEGLKLTCNRSQCNMKFIHNDKTRLGNWVPEYYKGVTRIPMNFSIPCPYCGMFDSHYVFEKNNLEERTA